MAKTPTKAASPKDKKGQPRTSIALMLLRQLTIHAMAAAKVPTAEIAKAFDLNRSFVIKQATLVRKPRNADERRIVKVAQDYEAAIRRAGFSGLLKTDEDTTVVLAGGERPKLGKLVDRQAKRAKAETKAPTKPKVSKPKVKAPVKAKASKPAKPKVTVGKVKPLTKADKARHAAQRAAEPDSTRDPVTFAPKAPTKAKTPKLSDLTPPDPETLKVTVAVTTPPPVPEPVAPDPFALLG
jgi:hypothetical protein